MEPPGATQRADGRHPDVGDLRRLGGASVRVEKTTMIEAGRRSRSCFLRLERRAVDHPRSTHRSLNADNTSPCASLDTKAAAPSSNNRAQTSESSLAVTTITFISGRVRDLTTRLQSMDVREVHIEHHDVGLKSLRRFQQGASVGDASHHVAVQ